MPSLTSLRFSFGFSLISPSRPGRRIRSLPACTCFQLAHVHSAELAKYYLPRAALRNIGASFCLLAIKFSFSSQMSVILAELRFRLACPAFPFPLGLLMSFFYLYHFAFSYPRRYPNMSKERLSCLSDGKVPCKLSSGLSLLFPVSFLKMISPRVGNSFSTPTTRPKNVIRGPLRCHSRFPVAKI